MPKLTLPIEMNCKATEKIQRQDGEKLKKQEEIVSTNYRHLLIVYRTSKRSILRQFESFVDCSDIGDLHERHLILINIYINQVNNGRNSTDTASATEVIQFA